MTPIDWKCPRRVGFLFPHACTRTTPVNCPDCRGGEIEDPYRQRTDRFGYNDFDTDDLGIGAGLLASDFTEADGQFLVKPKKKYEDDWSAS